jgi:hypothetical protein
MQGANEGYDVGLELGDLLRVASPNFLESADLLAKALFAVRRAAQRCSPTSWAT